MGEYSAIRGSEAIVSSNGICCVRKVFRKDSQTILPQIQPRGSYVSSKLFIHNKMKIILNIFKKNHLKRSGLNIMRKTGINRRIQTRDNYQKRRRQKKATKRRKLEKLRQRRKNEAITEVEERTSPVVEEKERE